MRMAQQVQLTEELIPRLTGRPGEQKRLIRSKQSLKQRMIPELNKMLRWMGGGYVGFAALPAAIRQQAALAAHADQWSIDVICRGTYPWELDGNSSAGGGGPPLGGGPSREQLITQLRMHTCEVERANEELELLAKERARCLAFLELQETAIQAAVERTLARQAALAAGHQVAACSSFGARQPAHEGERFEEGQYCAGLLMLLGDRLQPITSQPAAARTMFAGSDWDAALAMGTLDDEYDLADEEEAM